MAPSPDSVDAKSATKVPEGTEPKDFVDTYYKNCENDDWEAAFEALPADKKTGNSPQALKDQVSSYGIESYEIISAETSGDTATIKVAQVTKSFGTFENTWTFAKKDGTWFVTSKKVTGMM